MIAINLTLMTAVFVGIVSLLAWAIVSNRQTDGTAELFPSVANLTSTLERGSRGHNGRTHAPVALAPSVAPAAA